MVSEQSSARASSKELNMASDELRSNKHSGTCFSQQKTIIIIHVELGLKSQLFSRGLSFRELETSDPF